MKVLILMTQFHTLGGAERLAVELAEKLNQRGIRTDILSMYTEDLPSVTAAKEALLCSGIPFVHSLDMRIHPPITSLFSAILKLRRIIREQEYDIIETSAMLPTVIASWATWGMRVRHVAGLHHVFRRVSENSMLHKLWRISILCNPRIRYYAVSDYVAKHWIEYSKTSPLHTRRIYNAITNDFFSAISDRSEVREELGLSEDAHIAIYVGRLAAFKGIDTILDSLGPVLKQKNIILLYVGRHDLYVNGTREMLQNMEQRIIKENWGNRVKYLGFRKDIPRLMASSDVLVHPSQKEGFGLTLVEAMATGLQVVASNVEGIPEVLAMTDSLMVTPDDPKALRAKVLKILNRTPDEVANAITKGRKRAQDFNIDKRADAMVKLFEDVLSSRF